MKLTVTKEEVLDVGSMLVNKKIQRLKSGIEKLEKAFAEQKYANAIDIVKAIPSVSRSLETNLIELFDQNA